VDGEWEMATRSLIGANGRFFNDGGRETFRRMFLDAAQVCGPNPADENGGLFSLLDPSYVYSFVFQHPDNQIVTKVATPLLFLIRMYEIEGDGRVTEHYPDSAPFQELIKKEGVSVWHPQSVEKSIDGDFASLNKEWSTMERPHREMGLVLCSPISGTRCTYRNPTFELVRHLRGNQPKLQYQYLELRQNGKVGDYLKHFPAAATDFTRYRAQVHLFTKTLHENYLSCFVQKTKPLKEFSGQFKPHMWALHEKYRTELREKKEHISFSVCVAYVNTMPPARLLFSLNWHTRANRNETLHPV
jgi:hypothetical protein